MIQKIYILDLRDLCGDTLENLWFIMTSQRVTGSSVRVPLC